MSKEALKKIQFHYLYKPFFFKDRSKLKRFVLRLLKKEGKTVETINYVFCKDDYLLDLNLQYLKHNNYTDIITFELSGSDQPLLADVYISIDRVKENAKNIQTSFLAELHRVIFHGALHLAGYKDKIEQHMAEMRKKEDKYLNDYLFHVK